MPQIVFKKLPISLCIVTLNEEDNIQRCIESVTFASDIVILDSGSTDKTKDLALRLGARVFEEPWKGFGLQKQRAVELALHDWVLCLDADEELSFELATEIYEAANDDFKSNHFNSYKMPRRSFYLGRWLYFGGWYPDYQTRLFNRTKSNWSSETLHESVQGLGTGNDLKIKTKSLKFNLNHYPFENLTDQIQTNNRYSTLGAEALLKKGQTVRLWQLIVKPFIKFIELYFVKLGFCDGIPGYIIAMGGAYSYFLKYAKAWEQQHSPPKKV